MAGDVVKVDDAGYLDLIADRGPRRKLCQCICLFGHQVCDGQAHHFSVEAFLAVEIAVDQGARCFHAVGDRRDRHLVVGLGCECLGCHFQDRSATRAGVESPAGLAVGTCHVAYPIPSDVRSLRISVLDSVGVCHGVD